MDRLLRLSGAGLGGMGGAQQPADAPVVDTAEQVLDHLDVDVDAPVVDVNADAPVVDTAEQVVRFSSLLTCCCCCC